MKHKFSVRGYLVTDFSIERVRSVLARAVKELGGDPFHIRLLPLQTQTLIVYVPRPGTPPAQAIAPGSAIVGQPVDDQQVQCYYEGAVHGQEMSFDDKLMHAADRLVTHYPTCACGVFYREDLFEVGTFVFTDDWASKKFTPSSKKPMLDAWCSLQRR